MPVYYRRDCELYVLWDMIKYFRMLPKSNYFLPGAKETFPNSDWHPFVAFHLFCRKKNGQTSNTICSSTLIKLPNIKARSCSLLYGRGNKQTHQNASWHTIALKSIFAQHASLIVTPTAGRKHSCELVFLHFLIFELELRILCTVQTDRQTNRQARRVMRVGRQRAKQSVWRSLIL